MIARHWRGWTKLKDAKEYEALLEEKVFRSLKQINGYHGGYVLRRDEEESGFIVINFSRPWTPYGSSRGKIMRRRCLSPKQNNCSRNSYGCETL